MLRASANESDLDENVDLIATLCSSLKLLAINDSTCQRMADEGLQLLLSLLQKHARHDKVAIDFKFITIAFFGGELSSQHCCG